jgi:uncharacterized protein involved in tolerance to divalent cations
MHFACLERLREQEHKLNSKTEQSPRATVRRRLIDLVRYGTPEARAEMQRLAVERRARGGAAVIGSKPVVPLSPRARRAYGALIAVCVALWVAAALIPFPVVTAVRVDATVLTGQTSSACNSSDPGLMLRFRWHGRLVTEGDYLQPCKQNYRAGERLAIYVASNDPSDTANNAQSILNPGGPPFVGPNDGQGLLELFGLILGFIGAAELIQDSRVRKRRKAATAPSLPGVPR